MTVFGLPFPLAIAVIAFIILLLALITLKLNWVSAKTDEVKVISGLGEPKRLRGAGGFKVPFFQTVSEKSLTPIRVVIDVAKVVDSNQVPVSVTGSGQVSVGPSDEQLKLFTNKYLTLPDQEIERRVNEIVNGDMRSIIATMTIEALTSDRATLRTNVLESAEASLKQLGLVVDGLTINSLDDENDYIRSLGKKQIASVKRDAAIAEADAERETMERRAESTRLGRIAQTESETQIAAAVRDQEIAKAGYLAEVQAKQAESAQAGPLAAAKASVAVALAKADADRQSEEAGIAVEEQRALRSRKAQEAEVLIPAEARKQASIIEAEGKRQAAVMEAEGLRDANIAAANATAQKRTLESRADADARKALADAALAEAVTQADGERARLTAEADGIAARLNAEAEGQSKMADALKNFTSETIRVQVLPRLIDALPGIISAATAHIAAIDKVVMIGSGSENKGGGISGFAGSLPTVLASALEAASAAGLDIPSLLGGKSTDIAKAEVPSVDDQSLN